MNQRPWLVRLLIGIVLLLPAAAFARPALWMVAAAEKEGRLHPGSTVLEPTLIVRESSQLK